MAYNNGNSNEKPSPLLSRRLLGYCYSKKNINNANGGLTNPVGKIKYRKIPSQKFLYEISEDGTIRNVKSKKVLKWDVSTGYARIQLGHNNPKVSIHSLVMECWGKPKPSSEYEIDHIDSNPKNNHISNLQWITHKENMNKRKPFLTGQERAIKIEDTWTGEIIIHHSLNGTARLINSSGGNISRVIKNGNLYRKRYLISYID